MDNSERELHRIGREAITALARTVVADGSLIQSQLLASVFYDALQGELKRTPERELSRRSRLQAAARQCRPIAGPHSRPALVLAQVKAALDIIETIPDAAPRDRYVGPPQLRVVQGGRA